MGRGWGKARGGMVSEPVRCHLAQLRKGHVERFGAQLDNAPDAGRLGGTGVVDIPERSFFGDQMYGPREIARVNIGLLGSPASLERKFRPCEAANDGLRNDAVEQLARTVCVRRADHVHGELEKLVNRSE